MTHCFECHTTFAAFELLTGQSATEIARLLDEQHPNCACEKGSVSQFSSGVVHDDEIMIRLLVSPHHINRKRKVPAAAALSHAEKHGLSIMRLDQATDQNIRNGAERLVRNARNAQTTNPDEIGVFGVLEMKCGIIRQAKADNSDFPAYCVYDTALEENPSHSECFQRVYGADQALTLARRQALFASVSSSFISVEKFRNGFLADLAPRV